MKAIVIGATGTIGKAVSKALEDEGYEVLKASRNSNPGIDIENAASVKAFFNSTGTADVIVVAAGTASFGKLNELEENDFQKSVNSKLLGQVRVAQTGLKALNPKGTIVLTGGMLAYVPWPETSAVAMVNKGVEGFVKGAGEETSDDKKVVVIHPPYLAETAKKLDMDPDKWPNAEKVAAAYIDAIKSARNGTAAFVDGYRP